MALIQSNSVEKLLALPAEVATGRLLARLITELKQLRHDLLTGSRGAQRRAAQVLLSLREAARRLGVDRNTTLASLIASKRLRTVQVNGRLKVPVAEISRLAKEGFDTVAPAPKPTRPRAAPSAGTIGETIRALKLKP